MRSEEEGGESRMGCGWADWGGGEGRDGVKAYFVLVKRS